MSGAKFYDGKPCTHGHGTRRYAASKVCVVCSVSRAAKWNKDHPEQHNAGVKRYSDANKDKISVIGARWRKENAAHHLARVKKWSQENKAARKEIEKKSKLAHVDRRNAEHAARRAARLQRTPKWVGAEEKFLIREAYRLATLRGRVFGFKWHVDHVLPLQGETVSGLHTPWNLQVIPGVDNMRKGNRI